MLRLMGAAILLGACTMAGWSAAAMLRLRVEQLEAFVQLISHIEGQIAGFRAPLDRIFAGWENRRLEQCGILGALRDGDSTAAIRACEARLYLTGAEKRELSSLFEGLGRRGIDEETRRLAYYSKRIGGMASAARGELAGKMKLCRAIGILAGISAAVLLL